MTYGSLCSMLEHIAFNHEEHWLPLNLRVLELSLDGSMGNWNNVLWYRFAQNEKAFLFPEIIEIYKMRDLCYTKEQWKAYETELSAIGDLLTKKDIEDSKENHDFLNMKKQTILASLKSKAKSLYDDIKKQVGDAIFEDIRYDLNPRLGHHIILLYNLMQNEVGNLFDKKTFIEATRFSTPDEIKLLINIYQLAMFYEELDILMEDIAVNVRTHQFENLYMMYRTLLVKSPEFNAVNDALSIIENGDTEMYSYQWIKKMKELINNCYPEYDSYDYNYKPTLPDANKLYVIINGHQKFKNKSDAKELLNTEAIRMQLTTAKKRFAAFGTESMKEG